MMTIIKCTTLLTTGLCGSARMAELGGIPYVLPTPHKDKVSQMMCSICRQTGYIRTLICIVSST